MREACAYPRAAVCGILLDGSYGQGEAGKSQLRTGQVVAAEILCQLFIRLNRSARQSRQSGGQKVVNHALRHVQPVELFFHFFRLCRGIRLFRLYGGAGIAAFFLFGSTGGLLGTLIRDILRQLRHGKRFIRQDFKQQAERVLAGKLPARAGAAADGGIGIHKIDGSMVGCFSAARTVRPVQRAVFRLVPGGKAALFRQLTAVFRCRGVGSLRQDEGFSNSHEQETSLMIAIVKQYTIARKKENVFL